jgi:hypothetical protein
MATEIYVPRHAEGFEFCYPERSEDFETLYVTLNGTPRCGTWRSPPMRFVRTDEGKSLSASDSPWLGSFALVFRRHALADLEAMLLSHGELLRLDCSEPDVVLFNVTRVLDALDETASDIWRFSSGKLMRVARYVFRPEVVSGVDIFKIPNLRVSPTFVSERFVEMVKAARIRGAAFTKVWSE